MVKIWSVATVLAVTRARVAKDIGKKCIGVLVTMNIDYFPIKLKIDQFLPSTFQG